MSRSGASAYLTGGVTPNLQSSWEWVERTGARKKVDGVPAGSYLFPRLSPDGQRVAVNVRRPASRIADIWIYDALRAAPTRLPFEGNNSSPVWSPDGNGGVQRRRAGARRTSMSSTRAAAANPNA